MVEFNVPDPYILAAPTLVTPEPPHPRHTLPLSPLDDQPFLRFAIKYLYVYNKPAAASTLLPCGDELRASLARALAQYPPLAGRVRPCCSRPGGKTEEEDEKSLDIGGLEVDCNGDGALFTEAAVDMSTEEFLRWASWPNRSWRKLLYRPTPPDGQWLFGVPPLVVQVTRLSCGGMILCTAINHCVMDGVASAQFLQTWAHFTANNHAGANNAPLLLPVPPSHRRPPLLMPNHYIIEKRNGSDYDTDNSHLPLLFVSSNTTTPISPHLRHHHVADLTSRLLSYPPNHMTPVSSTFTPPRILHLKRALSPPTLKCTSFEALAAHVWRAWVRALVIDGPHHHQYPPSLRVKLLFSVNVRNRVGGTTPAAQSSKGYSGNAFVLACAECPADRLVSSNLRAAVELVQAAKARVDAGYVTSVVEALGERRGSRAPDLSASLVISQWSKLGLEDVDFGMGRPAHIGPLASEIYCLFLPVVGDVHAFNVLLSVPNHVAGRLEKYMADVSGSGAAATGIKSKNESGRMDAAADAATAAAAAVRAAG